MIRGLRRDIVALDCDLDEVGKKTIQAFCKEKSLQLYIDRTIKVFGTLSN